LYKLPDTKPVDVLKFMPVVSWYNNMHINDSICKITSHWLCDTTSGVHHCRPYEYDDIWVE
jgi:hypothetical protein